MKRFTILEFASLCGGISYNGADKKIDSLIKNVQYGKLQGEINRTTELIEGKLTKVVYISDDLLSVIRQPKNDFVQPVKQANQELNNSNSLNDRKLKELNDNKSNYIESAFMEKVVTELISTKNQLINYAEQVGQVKLLTDSESRTKDEYFKQVQDIAILKSKFNEIELINNQLKNENSELKETHENLKTRTKRTA